MQWYLLLSGNQGLNLFGYIKYMLSIKLKCASY